MMLSSVVCIDDKGLWTCYTYFNVMAIYILNTLRGYLWKVVGTLNGQEPYDIAMLKGNLVYTDSNSKCIDILEREAMQFRRRPKPYTIISLEGWIPQGVCSTRSDDLLVIMKSEDDRETRVVRYTYIGNREMKEKNLFRRMIKFSTSIHQVPTNISLRTGTMISAWLTVMPMK